MTDKTLKHCNFCRPANELNTEEIPFWSKKNENYSPYPKMVMCDTNYSLKNPSIKEIPAKLTENALSVKLELGKDAADKYIFFWAASEQNPNNQTKINFDEKAYGDYENHGMKKTDKKGNITLQFNCPQPYKDKKQTYCRHVHYILESGEKTWLPLKTIRLICSVNISQLGKAIKRKDSLIICALPASVFKKQKQITGAINLPIDGLEKISDKVKESKVIDFLKSNIKSYPKLNKLVTTKKLDIKDVPIITYCANKKCDASKKLLDVLYQCKVNNTKEWHDGIEGWNKSSSFFDEEEDSTEAEEDEDAAEAEEEEEEDAAEEEAEAVEEEAVEEEAVEEEAVEEEAAATEADGAAEEEEEEEEEEDDDEDEEDEDDEDDEDEDDEDEDDEDEEDELISVEHEGVDYIVIGDTFCDSYLDPIGKGKYDAKTGKVTDMDTKLQTYHDKNKNEIKSSDNDSSIKKNEKGKTKSVAEPKGDDIYTRDYLSKAMKNDLKDIVKQLASREKNTYEYDNIKGMNKRELVKLVSVCQGKKYRTNTETDYKFPNNKELDSMEDDKLRELVNSMTNREPDTYKYTESSWSKPKLIDFILQCQGIPKPRRKGGNMFVGGGWGI